MPELEGVPVVAALGLTWVSGAALGVKLGMGVKVGRGVGELVGAMTGVLVASAVAVDNGAGEAVGAAGASAGRVGRPGKQAARDAPAASTRQRAAFLHRLEFKGLPTGDEPNRALVPDRIRIRLAPRPP